MSEEIEKLTQEEMDVVIYDARAGDIETLQEIFDEIPKGHLMTIKDDITLSTPVHMAAANGHLETVKYLLSLVPKSDAETLVRAKNETGNTALHWAAYNGHLAVVQLLIEEYHADPFDKNEAGHDAIYEAENNGKTEVESWFLKKYTPEQDFTVEEDGASTKVTYTPGKESKLADDNARDAVFASSVKDGYDGESSRDNNNTGSSQTCKSVEEGVAQVSLND
ncbi:uncharacterized protein LODBEIA_P59600 [Lodderomyces beijingensis]|uniref:Ankyrin repeat-containing protein YAR1 n=1 Tax=Lodderomyces beijingensis TaxID=1775926 RepID=A0ABP0ZW26_9ASCO